MRIAPCLTLAALMSAAVFAQTAPTANNDSATTEDGGSGSVGWARAIMVNDFIPRGDVGTRFFG